MDEKQKANVERGKSSVSVADFAPFVPASSFRLRFFSFFAVCRSTAVPELVLYQSNFGDYLAVMS